MPKLDRNEILKATKRFAITEGRTPSHVLLFTSSTSSKADESFESAKNWAQRLLLELFVDFAIVSYPEDVVEEIERVVDTDLKPVLLDDNDRRRPELALNQKHLVSITLAPCYPVTNPRYAPHTALVVTWMKDIMRGQKSSVAMTDIRGAMEREYGYVYDANELMLPLPKA